MDLYLCVYLTNTNTNTNMYNCAQVALASKDVYKKMFWVQSLMDAAALIVAPTNYHHTTNRSFPYAILIHIIFFN